MKGPTPSSNTVNVSLATVLSTRGSGTVTKNRHPVVVKDETGSGPSLEEAMEYLHLHPMEYFRNSQVLEAAYGAELQLNDLTLTCH